MLRSDGHVTQESCGRCVLSQNTSLKLLKLSFFHPRGVRARSAPVCVSEYQKPGRSPRGGRAESRSQSLNSMRDLVASPFSPPALSSSCRDAGACTAAEGLVATGAPARNRRGHSRSARPSGTPPLDCICEYSEVIKCLCQSFWWK